MSGSEPKPDSENTGILAEIQEIFKDAVLIICTVVTIFAIDELSHMLKPPDGPIFLSHSRFEFPFQWMIDLGHIAAFTLFIIRVAWRMWRRIWR